MSENVEMVSFDMPMDVISDILSRLPVKSLLRFKSVCKTWYALIENPNFIEKHQSTQSSISPNSPSILVTTYNPKTGKCGMQLHFSNEEFDNFIDLDFPFLANRRHVSILGICNGLVCVGFSNYDPNLIICNPTTGQFVRTSPFRLSGAGDEFVFLGFTLHENDYKFIRLLYYTSPNGEVVVQVEVYTMSTNVWREIDVQMGKFDALVHLESYGHYNEMPLVLNGVFYWEACDSEDGRLVSFDISNGVFNEIGLREVISAGNETCWRLLEFKEELGLIIYCGDREFECWVLNKNTNSWSLKLKIEDFPIIARPFEYWEGQIAVVGYARNGELLLEDRFGNDLKLLLYNLNSREIKSLICADVAGATGFYLCTESLVSVNKNNEVAVVD